MYASIDGSTVADRAGLHDTLARQLSFPAWYGRNLDALFDCLGDITEDTELHLIHTDALFARLGVYADVFQSVLRDVCEENPHIQLFVDDAAGQED